MKKMIAVLSVGILLYSCIAAAQTGYEGATWGMDMLGVKQCFPGETFQEQGPGTIYFSGQEDGQSAIIGFDFTNNSLQKITFTYQIETDVLEEYTDIFGKIEQTLIQKYGSPSEKTRVETKDPDTSDAYAISYGDGSYVDEWTTSDGNITLKLTGGNFRLQLEKTYTVK